MSETDIGEPEDFCPECSTEVLLVPYPCSTARALGLNEGESDES